MSGSSAIGSVLTISKDAIKAIDDIDAKLKSLQTTMSDTAKKANTEFTNMASSTKAFSDALDVLITKTGKVGSAVQSVAIGMGNAWSGVSASSGAAATSIEQLAKALKGMSGVGTSGVQNAALNLEKLQEAMKNPSGMNIAELKENIKSINDLMSDKATGLTQAEQDQWNTIKRTLEQELKYQLQTIEERKVSHQKAVDQMIAAEERLAKKQQNLYKGNASSYQAQNNKANSTYSGALAFSDTANTINRQTKAIEYLEAAKKSLSRTDTDYAQKLQALNAAIEKNKQAIQAASVATQSKNDRDAYLANTQQVVANSKQARTIEEISVAIKDLEAAKEKLNTADTNYITKLRALNTEIDKNKQKIQEASVETLRKSEKEAYLSNSGQVLAKNSTAQTLQEMSAATKELEQARARLKVTDTDYEQKLRSLNEAILKNKQAIQAASASTTEKSNRDTYLSNTSKVVSDTNSAKTLQEHTAAIKELQQARLMLNATDKDYKQNLVAINEAIAHHTKVIEEAKAYNKAYEESVRKASAAEKEGSAALDMSKHVKAWQDAQAQIELVTKRQNELTQAIRQYEGVQQRGGSVSASETAAYTSAKKEYEANLQVIASLREKQQATIAATQAMNQQAQAQSAIKNYVSDSNSLDNQRSANTLAEMREYYKELEKSSAKTAREAERRAAAEEKAYERAAAAAEKAAEREMKASGKAAAAAEAKAQKEAAAVEKTLASQQYQSYMSAPSLVVSNNEGVKTLREHANAIKELQQARLNLDTTDKNYKQNLNAVNEAIKQHSKALREAGANTRNLQEQTSYLQQYLERWATRTAALFSINFAQNLVNQVVEVRGQFEMSQRSLEAILQDKSKADEIFNKTVELAVQSPFQIKDLVDYTRQLSAYRIESDKLYDTTKRLADVSAGLGVDMGRLILAYGQVKAAAYLRGSEVRQFTEAGINMYGELQAYFKEVKGEAYTTEQIVDMISKRMVTFADVEQVFQRMTDKGGTFYNMQAIQAETLQGKVANLKDSIDVMMNAIGKDNEGLLKGAVSAATGLLNCWEGIASAAKGVASLMALMVLYSKQMGAAKMSQMFTTNLSGLGTQVSLLGKLGAAAKSTAGAVVNFSKNLAGAVLNNTILIGLAALVKLVYEGYKMWNKWSDAVNKADEQMVESRGVIGALASSYRDLASAAGGLKGDQLAANIADRRAQLQKLVDAASKDGLKLTINVADIDENKLDATFNQVKKKYADFVDEINIVLKAHAANENWDTWLTDGVGDDMADYKDAVVDALATQKQLDAVISEINAHYGAATAATKKYFDEIRNGQKDGESNYDYMVRMVNVIQELNKKTTGGKFTMANIFGGKAESDFKDVFSQIDDARRAAEELDSEFDNIFESLKGEKDKVKIQAVIDRVAAEKEWNQYARDLAYKKFGITVNIDKAKAQQEVSWVDDYLTKFFAQKKYSVRLQVKQITDDKAQEDFLGKGDTAGKAAKNWAEIEKRIKAVGKNTKTIKVDDSLRKLFNAGDQRISGKTIEVSTLKAMVAEYKKAAIETANALGVDPFEKRANEAQKAQRDLLNERIQLLKDMASKYAELTKWETKEKALADTRSYFSDAAKNVGMDISSFVPDKRTVAAKIKEIANQYKELTKRGSGLRVAADLVFDVRQEKLKENLEKVKNQIQESLDGLSLFRKLNDVGLDKDTIRKMFGDSFATSFEDVRNQIESVYNEKWGTDKTKWSPETTKQYTEEVKKLNKQQYDEQISQFMELTKAYKNQLSEQLQLDRWYMEEKAKIQDNENLAKNPILKQQYQSNLDKEYKTKTDENTWKQFTGTNTYIEMFENLEYTSISAINTMLDQLGELKASLNNLPPDQVKAIVEQMEKLRDIKMDRYPLVGFAQSVKDIETAQKEYVAATKQYVSAQKEKEAADNELALARANLNELENNRTLLSDEEYNNQIIVLQEDVAEAMERQKTAIENLNIAQDNVASKNNRVTTAWMRFANQVQNLGSRFKTVTTNINTLVSTISGKASSKTEKWIKLLGTTVNEVGNVVKAYKDLGSNALKPIEKITDKTEGIIDSTGNLCEKTAEGIEGTVESASAAINSTSTVAATAIQTVEKASVILAIISAALQVAQAIADLFSDEGDIDDYIEDQQLKVQKLQNAYDKLKESVDNCFDLGLMKEYAAQTEANLRAQIVSFRNQISAEKSRKSPDEGVIADLEQDIVEAEDKIKELSDTVKEELGGFGSDENYKSAAEAFAEAWMDAFNECSSGIEALNDKWDEYFNSLITKQLMMRASTKYIKPLLAAVDKAVSDDSSGGTALTKQEVAQLTQLKNEALQGYSQYAQELMDALGIKPSGTVELSGLQQGIQGVTEATAQALESILNSMRYYLATQQADVRTIRDTLIARLGTATASVSDSTGNNQMITILEEQTGYLRTLSNNFSDVIKAGHSKGGKGLKVFLN